MKRFGVGLAVTSLLALSACKGSSTTVSEAGSKESSTPIAASKAVERWKALGVMSYSFHYREIEVHGHGVIGVVTVTDGRVAGWRPDPGHPEAIEKKVDEMPTIDSLLALAVRGKAEAKGTQPPTRLVFDPVTGVPTSAYINWSEPHFATEWQISDFRPAGGEPTATSVS
jgi:hypothetical protein